MLPTQDLLDALADRIERAYRLRRPWWHGGCSTTRVWSVAAGLLLRAHEADPGFDPDPELFVAAQPEASPYPDPWVELTQPTAALHYRRRVRGIVRALRGELAEEVRLAEERIGSGQAIGRVLQARNRRLSPLGKFIVAHRAGRAALAKRLEPAVLEQHHSCPLYRQAALRLLPPDAYPVSTAEHATQPTAAPRRARPPVHLN